MTFKLQKNRTFRTTVNIKVPTDNGITDQSFVARFRVMDDADSALQVDDFLRRAILHVEDVQDDDGELIASSDDLIARLVAQPFVRVALITAYWAALSGAKAGN